MFVLQLPKHSSGDFCTTWEITPGKPVGTQNSRWFCVGSTVVRLGDNGTLKCRSAFCGRHCSHTKAVSEKVHVAGAIESDDAFILLDDEMEAQDDEAPEVQTRDTIAPPVGIPFMYPMTSEDAKRMCALEKDGLPCSEEHALHLSPPKAEAQICQQCGKKPELKMLSNKCTVYFPRPIYAQVDVSIPRLQCDCKDIKPEYMYNLHDDALCQLSHGVFISAR